MRWGISPPKLAAVLLFLAACSAGCSASTRDADHAGQDEAMPFIKLAQRDMALVVYFAGDAIRPGTQEEIERKAATQLKNTYRIPVLSYRREGAFVRFQPDLEMELVEKSVDDVVVVDIAAADHELHGHVQVLAMYDHRVAVDQK